MADVDPLYLTLFWWTLGALGVVWMGLAVALLVLRARTRRLQGPDSIERSGFEILWAMAPALIVVLVAVPTFRGLAAEPAAPEPAPPIEAIAPAFAPELQEWPEAELVRDSDDALAGAATDCCETGRRIKTGDDDLLN